MVAAVLGTALSSCGNSDQTPPRPGMPAPATPAPEGAARGSLVDHSPVPDLDPGVAAIGATETRVRYRSTSGVDGGGAEVTGSVFVPAGPAPADGWPIVTVGHGTTGVTDDCAPSKYPDLLGDIDLVIPLLQRGFVVAATDYDGLGTDRPHPYLEPDTAAYNLIDAVRAARALVPDTSARWAALGESQGGQASWSAAEHAESYGDGLVFLGAANLSPAADLTPVAAAPDVNLTLPQQIFVPLLIAGLQVSYPDLDPSAYLRGTLAASKDVLVACTGPAETQKFDIAMKLAPDDSRPRTDDDRVRMLGWLRSMALPKRLAGGPMLVAVDEEDNLVPADWTRQATERACALGDVVELRSRPGGRHADSRDIPGAVAWIADRFAGRPVTDTCASGGSSATPTE